MAACPHIDLTDPQSYIGGMPQERRQRLFELTNIMLGMDDPALIPDPIEEILRYNPAVIAFRRTAMEDVELGGQQISKGDKIELFYGAACADEAVFADSDSFDITRNQREDVRNEHRAFGVGQHFCMGSHLARLELLVIFEEIIRRIRKPRLNAEINWLRSNFINGIKAMPIAFDVAPD